jgi:ubiquinone/menaquinone biosynthesis C-methylase UbiE
MSDAGEIKSYWDGRAASAALERTVVTLPDHNQRRLEIETICRFLSSTDRLLDIGCGNGYATAVYSPLVREVIAIDYSEPMIERARKENPDLPNVAFRLGNVMALDFAAESFDTALTQRCLINLPTWEDQKAALTNIHRVLRAGVS